jgi:hypothetical protein
MDQVPAAEGVEADQHFDRFEVRQQDEAQLSDLRASGWSRDRRVDVWWTSRRYLVVDAASET